MSVERVAQACQRKRQASVTTGTRLASRQNGQCCAEFKPTLFSKSTAGRAHGMKASKGKADETD